MFEINHFVEIKGSLEEVYAALSTIDGLKRWWTAETSGRAEPGGVVRFDFGPGSFNEMQVTELATNARVRWVCVGHPDEWLGTEFTFALTEAPGLVRVRFTQAKWQAATDFHAYCSTKWATFLLSLKEAVETGVGRPYPHDLQISHG